MILSQIEFRKTEAQNITRRKPSKKKYKGKITSHKHLDKLQKGLTMDPQFRIFTDMLVTVTICASVEAKKKNCVIDTRTDIKPKQMTMGRYE